MEQHEPPQSADENTQTDLNGSKSGNGAASVPTEAGHAPPAAAELADAAEDASANDATASVGDEADTEE